VTGAAALLTAIAALISSLAWPLAFVTVFILFRSPIAAAARRLPSLIDRMNKVKVGFLEAELERTGAAAAAQPTDQAGEVTREQIRAAARIEVQAAEIGAQPLLEQMRALCLEYERTRGAAPPGRDRTKMLTEIIAKMRALGPSLSGHIEEFKSSDLAGSRLAAVAIMQLKPEEADFPWLLERFRTDQPFVFYQSALVLKNTSRSANSRISAAAKATAEKALDALMAYKGPPDEKTIAVLKSIVDYR